MEFLISDTFTDSLTKLTNDEQKAVKTTVFDLQVNPSSPGLQFHKLDKARDPNFWSMRVNRDIRLILHKTNTSLLICYVAHHDDAYRWAERRKLETHPKTGAAQIVEIRERIQEIIIPTYVASEKRVENRLVFSKISEEEILSHGIPEEWLQDVKTATEDTLLELIDHLPREAAEALLQLATGNKPKEPVQRFDTGNTNPFEHPDAQRRFRVMHNVEELERALDYPWEKWTIFLHPAQRETVEKVYNGPARVSGSAGTGKTIVALHRAVYLARANPDSRVMLATFSETLASSLRIRLRRLVGNEPRIGERLEVHSMNELGKRLYELNFGKVQIATPELINEILAEVLVGNPNQRFSLKFLKAEWEEVVDAWQLDTWETYREVRRLGRKTRLNEQQRTELWRIFEQVEKTLKNKEIITYAQIFNQLELKLKTNRNRPFEFVVIDEAQDISVSQLRYLGALQGDKPNGLFFAGDLGQRIFQQPFSWKSVGVDIRGRSTTLRVNYRTSHQIRAQADKLLTLQISDVDGNQESRKDTISVFNGVKPVITVTHTPQEEIALVGEWLSSRTREGVQPHEIGIFVRSTEEIQRACLAAEFAQQKFRVLDEAVDTTVGSVSIGTMHLAKGLEFRAVAVMACDDEIVPLKERLESSADEVDLEEIYNTERHLLYVACTRARDFLLVSSGGEPSEFLDDFRG